MPVLKDMITMVVRPSIISRAHSPYVAISVWSTVRRI